MYRYLNYIGLVVGVFWSFSIFFMFSLFAKNTGQNIMILLAGFGLGYALRANLTFNKPLNSDEEELDCISTESDDCFRRANKVIYLKISFENFKKIETLAELAKLSLIQLERTEEKFEVFMVILKKKFSIQELAYSKFYVTVEQVYSTIIEKLIEVEEKFNSIGGKDYSYVIHRLESLEKIKNPSKLNVEEIVLIKERAKRREKELLLIEELLVKVEALIQGIERVVIETNSLKTTSDIHLDEKVSEELEKLIIDAKLYNVN